MWLRVFEIRPPRLTHLYERLVHGLPHGEGVVVSEGAEVSAQGVEQVPHAQR